MGLHTGGGTIYLTIVNGKLAKRVKEKTKNSIERTLTAGTHEGKVVHEEVYTALTGLISKLETSEHEEYGSRLLIYIEDATTTYCVQCPLESGYAISFLKALPNCDLNREVTLTPREKEEKGKKKYVIFLKQGFTLKHAFTKDNPNGLPEPELIKRRGKPDEWNFFPVTDFLIKTALQPAQDFLSKRGGEISEDMSSETKSNGDLPF